MSHNRSEMGLLERPGVGFSVIIPTCDRPKELARALARLAPETQRFPASDYEVIVSDDSPASSARLLVATEFPWAKWFQGPQRGPASNRNHGATFARGEWLVFLDDDCIPSADWLTALARHTAEADLIEGRTICPDKRDTAFQEQIENLSGGAFWTCNLAVRRDAFLALGGFDEDFAEPCCEDMEFAWRARQRGLRTSFAETAVAEHPARRVSLRGLWKRTFMLRWHCLYELKTTQAAAPSPALWEQIMKLSTRLTLNLLRTIWCALASPPPGERKRALLLSFWNLLTFPVVLPYCCYWGERFRRKLIPHLDAPNPPYRSTCPSVD